MRILKCAVKEKKNLNNKSGLYLYFSQKGAIKKRFKKHYLHELLNDAGIDILRHEKFTFHSFRHTFAANVLSKTGNIFLLKKMLGHTSIDTTMRYSHLLDRDADKIFDT